MKGRSSASSRSPRQKALPVPARPGGRRHSAPAAGSRSTEAEVLQQSSFSPLRRLIYHSARLELSRLQRREEPQMSTGAMRLREVLKAILKGTKNALRQAEPESSPELLPHCPQSRNSLLLPQEIQGEAEELLLRAVSAPAERCEVLEHVSYAVEAVSQQASPLQIVALSSELQELMERIKSQQQRRLEELEELQYTIDSQVGVADHLIRRLSGLESEFQHIARVRRKAKPEVAGESWSATESAHMVDDVVAAVRELLEKQPHRNERHTASASSITAELVDSTHARRGPPALSFDHDEGGAELHESAWSDVTSDSCKSDNNSAKRSGWPFLKGAKTPKQANQNSHAFTLKLIPVTPGRKSITLAVGKEELLRATAEEVAEAEASRTSPVPMIDEDTAAQSLDSVTESELQSSDPQAPGFLPVDIACAAEPSAADLAALIQSEVQAHEGLDLPEWRPRTGYTTPCSDVPLSRHPSFGSLCDEPSPETPRKLMQDEQPRVYSQAGPAASTSAHQNSLASADHQQWSTARLVPFAHKDRLEELLALELMPAAPRWCRAKQPSATTHTQSQKRCLHGRVPASRWESSSQVSSCSSLALPNIDLATAGRTRALSTARGIGLHWVTEHCLSIEDVLEDRRVLREMRQEAAAETSDMWAKGPCTSGVTLSTSRWHANDGVHVLVQSSPRQSPRQSAIYSTPQRRVSLPSISPRAALSSNPGCGESLLMAEAAALPAARPRRNSLDWSMRLDAV